MPSNHLYKGAICHISGDTATLWIEDYNCRVNSDVRIEETPGPRDRKVRVTIFNIDGDSNVCTYVRRSCICPIEQSDTDNQNASDKAPWEPGSMTNSKLRVLLNRITYDRDEKNRFTANELMALALYENAKEEEPGMSLSERNQMLLLCIKCTHVVHEDPAFSTYDWADALIHPGPGGKLDIDGLLACDETTFAELCDRMAQYKRQTYTGEDHTEEWEAIMADIPPVA